RPPVAPLFPYTTLFRSSWSLDCWVVTPERTLLPSREEECRQWQELDEGLAIVTEVGNADLSLHTRAEVVADAGEAVCRLAITARSEEHTSELQSRENLV